MTELTELSMAGTAGRPASRLQTRLWFVTRLYPDQPLFTIPITLRLRGDLDLAGLRAALAALIRRHESLRTRFVSGEEGPVMVLDDRPPELALTDLSAAADPERAWSVVMTEELARPLDLERGPLIRGHLARIGPSEHLLAILVHHISVDGPSIEVLLTELGALYDAWTSGQDLAGVLGPGPASYDQFSQWLDKELSGPSYEKSREFWRTELGGQPGFDPPTDRPRSARRVFELHDERTLISADLATSVREFARSRRITPFVALAAIFGITLGRRSGPLRDVVIAAPWSLRHGPWLEGTVGFFINTVPMRIRVTPAATFRDVLSATRGAFLDAMDHGNVPFDEIVALVNPARTARRLPITSVSFQVLPSGDSDYSLGPVRAERQVEIDGASEFDLVWDVMDPGEGAMTISAKYTADIYDRDTIARMSAQFVRMLTAALAEPDRRVMDLPLDDDAERARLRGLGGAVAGPLGESDDGSSGDGPFLLLDDDHRPVSVGAVGSVYVPVPEAPDPPGQAEGLIPGVAAGLDGQWLRPTGVLAWRCADGSARPYALPEGRQGLSVTAADLVRHPDVDAAEIVAAAEVSGGHGQIIAYVATGNAALTPADLRRFLQDSVPQVRQPSWYVVLDQLPEDESGQVDREALNDIARSVGLGPASVPDESGTALEETVRRIWAEHLGGPVPGLDAAFFDIGGHSLAAVRIAARLQRLLGRKVPVRAVFDQPTVRSLAAWLDETGTDPAEERHAGGPPAVDSAPVTSSLAADLDAASEDELAILRKLTQDAAFPADVPRKATR